ncbi:type VI secretion system baseplate subunit TssG [Helicobacter saguini]|uniref:type VI secretion system baseplate subunit TssG n=1 Tax=Helicobacter saguini TaxID=1548018 RepID=UPI000512D30D
MQNTESKLDSNISANSFYLAYSNLLKKYAKNNIFLRVNNLLGCPNKEIDSIKINKNAKQLNIELFINFFGIQGSTSQLPSYMLDKLARNKDDGNSWSLLLDFFNHYLLDLFYEIILRKNYPRSFYSNFNQNILDSNKLDSIESSIFKDSISKILFNILGIDNAKMARVYLPFAPLILSLRKPKKYIQKVLETNFNLKNKISILENIPHQIKINKYQQNKLGMRNNVLGGNFIIGKTIISHQTKIAILINNISYQEALKFLPHTKKFQDLKDAVLFLTNNEFAFDLYLKINYSQIMSLKLGSNALNNTAKLGYGSVLGHKNQKIYNIYMNMWG